MRFVAWIRSRQPETEPAAPPLLRMRPLLVSPRELALNQPEMVIAARLSSEAPLPQLMRSSTPSKFTALVPILPVTCVGPLVSVPLLLLPELSLAFPSSFQCPCRPEVISALVAFASVQYAELPLPL